MNTRFSPAERSSKDDLAKEIAFVSENPITTGLLGSIGGILAILNEHRQIIALNDAFLKMLGIDDPSTSLGLRPGEALSCVHVLDEPGGCGTSQYCSTCGAALAIVTCLSIDEPVERLCALKLKKGGSEQDLAFNVRAQPVHVEGDRYILVFLHDVTKEEQRAAIERTFFHDVNNLLAMLIGAADMLELKTPSELGKIIQTVSVRLCNEIKVQHCLSNDGILDYKATVEESTASQVLDELRSIYAMHAVARDRTLEVPETCSKVAVRTDLSLLSRILCNMITNAFEATEKGGVVKAWADNSSGQLIFKVWNAGEISADVARRIFQRNFSTKSEKGRGIGTFSMKLFGEGVLGGSVSFMSSATSGTVFQFQLN